MRRQLFALNLVAFIFIACHVSFAQEAARSDPGWAVYKGGKISFSCPDDVNLKKLEARLRSRWFTVSAAEKNLYSNQAFPIEKRILARLESVLNRVEQILDMYPANLTIHVKVFHDRDELSREYTGLYGSPENYKSFYVHHLGTIFTSMQDVSDSIISHEIAHAVIDNYFRVIPPSKAAELLATYVDSHLEKD